MVAQYRKAAERRSQLLAASGEGRRPRPVNEQANGTCFSRQPTAHTTYSVIVTSGIVTRGLVESMVRRA